MGERELAGQFEEIVLLAILKLGKGAYGVPINEEVEAATGRSVSTGALYTTLSRLEEKGFVSSKMGESTAARGGRAKKYFTIESAGREALISGVKVKNYFLPELRTLAS